MGTEIIILIACVAVFVVATRTSRKRKNAEITSQQHPLNDKKRTKELFDGAKKLFYAKKYKDALRDIDQALSIEPEERSYLWLRASIYNAIEQYNEAIIDSEKIIELDSTYHWAYYVRGEAYLGLKQYDKALDDFEYTLLLQSDFQSANFNRLRTYLSMNDPNKADKLSQKMLNQYPNDSYTHAQIAVIHYKHQRFDKVAEQSDKLIHLMESIEQYPTSNPTALYSLIAWSHFKVKNYQKALNIIQSISSVDFDVTRIKAYCYEALLDFNNAKRFYGKALELEPDNVEVLLKYAIMLRATRQFHEGLLISERLINLEEKGSHYTMKSLMSLGLHQFEDSLSNINKAVELSPQDPIVFNNRSNIYFRLDNEVAALEDAKHALELDPNYVSPYINQATFYLNQNKIELALEQANTAIQLEPDKSDGYFVIALCFIMQSEYKEAYANIHKVDEIIKYDQGQVDFSYAILEQAQNNYDKAQSHWKEAVKKLPELENWEWVEIEYDFPSAIMEFMRAIHEEYSKSD